MRRTLVTSVLWVCFTHHSWSAAVTATTPASSPGSALDLWDYLPATWASFCTLDYDVEPDVNATITCHVTPHQKTRWRLADFRKALSSLVISQGLEIALKIECETGGSISLPFPFRAPGLVRLTVLNCRLLDKWADFDTPAQQLGDWLRVLDIRHCTWVNLAEVTFEMLNKMNSHYECGQDSTLVYIISRNISQEYMTQDHQSADSSSDNSHKDLDLAALLGSAAGNNSDLLNTTGNAGLSGVFKPTNGSGMDHSNATNLVSQILDAILNRTKGVNRTSEVGSDSDTDPGRRHGDVDQANSTTDMADTVLQTLIDLDNVRSTCRFQHLEVYDESFSQDTHISHFEFMVKDSTYPKLRLLNYTGIGLREIPVELRESRRKFHGSKLGIIDISYNQVQELGLIPVYPSRGVPTKLVVRHNNITKITLKMFQDLALVPDFTVDIRGNPIACNCDLKDFLDQLQDDKVWTEPGMKYYREHVSSLTCATPAELSGRVIGSVSTGDLPCPVTPADLRPVMIVLMVVVLILLTLLILAVKYRKEVRILMYTRVHILLPCGLPKQPLASTPEKTYDAFVAYAHQDSDWVLGSLLKRLEEPGGNPKGRQPCKLCIHQRDFVVGKPIIDNIVDSIAASRHTIVVLSNSFVKSGWAMEELEHAYRQSIEERRRHLVVVVLEEVAHSDMGPVLRRCCKTFTYLHVADTFFWDRLLYSIQVADPAIRSRKRLSLKAEGEAPAQPGTVNMAYSPDEERGQMAPTQPPMDEYVKRALYLETMRTLSVESTVSETKVPVTPSQLQVDRPLFEPAA